MVSKYGWLIGLWASVGMANPFIVSDPVPAGQVQPTHCGVWLDTAARIEIPVTSSAGGPYCKFDVGTVSIGSHTIKMTHVRKDAVWGDMESVQSVPLVFPRPAPPGTPSGVSLSP